MPAQKIQRIVKPRYPGAFSKIYRSKFAPTKGGHVLGARRHAAEIGIMKNDNFSACAHLNVQLDTVCALLDSALKRSKGVFYMIPVNAPVRIDLRWLMSRASERFQIPHGHNLTLLGMTTRRRSVIPLGRTGKALVIGQSFRCAVADSHDGMLRIDPKISGKNAGIHHIKTRQQM